MRLTLIALAAAAIVGAAAGYAAGLQATPYIMMDIQMDRFAKVAGGVNRILVGPPGKNLKRPIEKANPDIQAANCVFDLSNGPVRLYGPVWDGYWSLSFFGANSDVFELLTDRQVEDSFDVVIAGPGQAVSAPPGAEVVRSPSRRGITMIRMFVGTDDDKRRAHAAAKATVCEPLA